MLPMGEFSSAGLLSKSNTQFKHSELLIMIAYRATCYYITQKFAYLETLKKKVSVQQYSEQSVKNIFRDIL